MSSAPIIPQKNALRRWLAPLAILALMAAAYSLGLHQYLSFQSLADNRAFLRGLTADHYVLSLAAYIIVYGLAVALSIPGAVILTISGGFLFGWLAGGIAAVLAATLGASAIFLIAKSSFGEALARKAGPALAKLRDGFAADAFNYLLFLRLVPAFPFWLVNIAPAFANVRLKTFVAATFLGIIPGTFAFAFVGEGLDSIIAAQTAVQAACAASKGVENCPLEFAISALVTPQLLLAFATLGVVALIPVALRKWKGRHEV